jgi:hypothetical protein
LFILFILSLTAVLLLAAPERAAAQPGNLTPIDPVPGRQLMKKSMSGETLTVEEQAYLERVKKAIRQRAAGGDMLPDDGVDVQRVRTLMKRSQAGESLNADDQAYLDRARQIMRQRTQQKGGANASGSVRRRAPVDPNDWILEHVDRIRTLQTHCRCRPRKVASRHDRQWRDWRTIGGHVGLGRSRRLAKC